MEMTGTQRCSIHQGEWSTFLDYRLRLQKDKTHTHRLTLTVDSRHVIATARFKGLDIFGSDIREKKL